MSNDEFQWLLHELVSVMADSSRSERDRRRAETLWLRLTEGSGSMAAVSVGSGYVHHPLPKPDGAGWAEHLAIEDGDG